MKEKKEKAIKEKKIRVKKVGVRSVRVVLLWLLFVSGLAFAIYKNFTGIDTHTIYEKKVIEEKVLNTSSIECFAKEFSQIYFTWSNTDEMIQKRNEAVEKYVVKDLKSYAKNMVTKASGNQSAVTVNDVWNVAEVKKNEYKIILNVGQLITDSKGEKFLEESYEVRVHVNSRGRMKIIQLPTLAEKPKISNYEPIGKRQAENLDVELKDSVNQFLEDFYSVYPSSDSKVLKYYANEGVVPVIEDKAYEFKRIDSVIITDVEKGVVRVSTIVVYDSKSTNTEQAYQYNLVMEKKDNWKIVDLE